MWKQILKATLLAGVLDICAASLQAYLRDGTTPDIVLKFVASGALGKDAFTGGYGTMAMGLLFHFIIVFACAVIFFLLNPRLKFLHYSVLLNSLLISLIAWFGTTRVIIPLSKITPAPFDLKRSLIAAGILYVCIGLPISILAKQWNKNSKSFSRNGELK